MSYLSLLQTIGRFYIHNLHTVHDKLPFYFSGKKLVFKLDKIKVYGSICLRNARNVNQSIFVIKQKGDQMNDLPVIDMILIQGCCKLITFRCVVFLAFFFLRKVASAYLSISLNTCNICIRMTTLRKRQFKFTPPC